MNYCGTCGARLAPDSKFCSACGTAVKPPAGPVGSASTGVVPPQASASDASQEPPPPTPRYAAPAGHPAQVDPPHTRTPRVRRGRRIWLFTGTVAALLLVAAGAGATIWFRAQDLPNASTVDVPTLPKPAEPTFDDPLIDPCGLVSASDFAAFGQASLKQGDTFLDCDLIVQASSRQVEVSILITFNFYGPQPDGKDSRVENRGGIRVVRPQDAGDCETSVVASDGSFVTFEAHHNSNLDCSIVDAATDSAVQMLNSGSLPRLNYPANSLAHIDACELILAAGPARIIGGSGAVANRTSGGHRCDWAGNGKTVNATLRVEDSSPVPYDERGRPTTVAGRPAIVQPYSNDSGCEVSVEHLRNQVGRVEVLDVGLNVNGATTPVEQACTMVTDLATTMADALPPA
jgi:hypothetical protein